MKERLRSAKFAWLAHGEEAADQTVGGPISKQQAAEARHPPQKIKTHTERPGLLAHWNMGCSRAAFGERGPIYSRIGTPDVFGRSGARPSIHSITICISLRSLRTQAKRAVIIIPPSQSERRPDFVLSSPSSRIGCSAAAGRNIFRKHTEKS